MQYVFYFILSYFSFSSCTCDIYIWKFPGQGSNLSYSYDLCHSSSNIRSLTHCATVETPCSMYFRGRADWAWMGEMWEVRKKELLKMMPGFLVWTKETETWGEEICEECAKVDLAWDLLSFQVYEASKLRLQIGNCIYGSGAQKRGLTQEIKRYLHTDPTSVILQWYNLVYS